MFNPPIRADFHCRYNRVALQYSWVRILYRIVCIVALAGLNAALATAQTFPGTATIIVMPFDNHSKAGGLDWVTEACPEVLSQRMASPKVYVVSRDDRIFAFDRAGVPAVVHPSRATVFNVAEQMDADYVVLGSYEVNGNSFQVSAQLLDVKKLRLYPAVQSSGSLSDFVTLQTALAWQLLRLTPNQPQVTQQQFIQASQPIRLDAFENYIRGIMATNSQQKTRYFREAIRLNPGYSAATLQLGRVYYGNHEYEQAAAWLSKIPKDDSAAGEATFLLGLSEYYRGSLDRAYTAFTYLATRLPLTEVYNNLGVVDARRGLRAAAVEYFSKAVAADPSDSDYRFNLAVALFKNGDTAGAARQLREELQRRPSDAEAKLLLEMINRGVTAPTNAGAAAGTGLPASGSQPRIPIERIKRNYDEASYRQLQMELNNLSEQRLAKTARNAQTPAHLERGKQLLAKNANAEAAREFRDAITADGNSAAAHAGLAEALERTGNEPNARAEAQISLRLQPNAPAYLVLARLDLKQNQTQSASEAADKALALEPANTAGQALKREITAKQTASQVR